MAVASASPAVSKENESGPTESCWRQLNMTTTASLLSRSETIICLTTIAFLLERYHSSLSAYEKAQTVKFAILLAESMENEPEGPTITLPCSTTRDAYTAAPDSKNLLAVKIALYSLLPGGKAKYYSEHSNKNQPAISPDMSPKNTLFPKITGTESHLSSECPYVQELDSE